MKKHWRIVKITSILLLAATLMSLISAGAFSSHAASVVKSGNLAPNASFEDSRETNSNIQGWNNLDSGYSIRSDDSGNHYLSYSGNTTGNAQSLPITIRPNNRYLLSARLKKAQSGDLATVSVEGLSNAKLTLTNVGEWTDCQVEFSTSKSTLTVNLRAKGDVAFDQIRLVDKNNGNLLINGDCEENTGWTNGIFADASRFGGSQALGTCHASQSVNVKANTWYMLTADVYRNNLTTWKYLDMYPINEAFRLRGYQANTWEHLGGIWYSGSNTNTQIRSIVEEGWDDVSVSSSSDVSSSYCDNIVLKEVTVGDELISDSDFSSNGWSIESNGQIASIGANGSSQSLSSTMGQASDGKTVAYANAGNTISVEKNTLYALSAWVRIDGTKRTIKTILDMEDISDELQLESTTYHHDSKGNYWLFMSGIWNSGEHDSVRIRAMMEPTGKSGAVSKAYIDQVSFRKVEDTQSEEENLFANGDFEMAESHLNVTGWMLPSTGVSLSDEAYLGDKSIALQNEKIDSRPITLTQNTNYVLSAWVKASASSKVTLSMGSFGSATSVNHDTWEQIKLTFNSSNTTIGTIQLSTTGTVLIDALYLGTQSNYVDVGQTSLSSSAKHYEVASADTLAIIGVDQNKMYLEKLQSKDTGHNWVTPTAAQEVPMIGKVNGKTTAWKFLKAEISDTDGLLLTLTFTNDSPSMILHAYWQAYPGEEGPVQYWATIENKSGKTLSFQYADILSGDLMVTSDSSATLTYFERQTYTDLKVDNYTHTDELGMGYYNYNETLNEAAQCSREYRLPYEVIQTKTQQGLYFGHYWGFGNITVSTADNPFNIRISAGIGTEGTLTRKVNAGDMNGDGKGDPDMDLKIPGMFFGTFKGSLDNGCNRMKNWFWNHRMTETMRNNPDEPLVELHLPFNSEKEWSSYLSEHDVASWGVQLLKQDYWWTVPNSPPEDGSFNWDLHSKWNPNKTKWPNGMTLGEITHSYGLKQSLYFCDTFELTNLLDWTGRMKNYTALSSRLKAWNIDYYRSDFALQGPYETSVRNYAAYEGYMWMIDQLIANPELPNFRYESCSGGGTLKDFSSLERITFLTNEDSARAYPNRAVTYTDLYMINPAQIKMDIAIDWPPIEGSVTDTDAYNYYVFRTGLLGAMMICPSTRTSAFNSGELKAAIDTYGIYNTKQRAIIRNCEVYHIMDMPNMVDWDGIEYYNPSIKMGSILLFRPASASPYTEKRIYPEGLNPDAQYKVEFEDNQDLNVTASGAELMNDGILVRMDRNYDSEIIWLTEVQIEKTPVKSIQIFNANSETTVAAGTQLSLKAGILPLNASDSRIEWTSSDEHIAYIDDEGHVFPFAKGTVTLTAKATDGSGAQSSVTITVTERAPVENVTDDWIYVNDTSSLITYGPGSTRGGGGGQYYEGDETAICGFAEFTFEGYQIKWLSAQNVDCGKATVYIDDEFVTDVNLQAGSWIVGTVFTSDDLGQGTHTIKIVNKNKGVSPWVPMDALAYKTEVVETKAPDFIKIIGQETVLIGDKLDLDAKAWPDIDYADFSWSVSDESIATIDQNGVLTGIARGIVTVTAKSKDGSCSDIKNIRVKDPSETETDSEANAEPIPVESQSENTNETKPSKSGCRSSMTNMLILPMVFLGLAGAWMLRKKESD